MSGAHSLYINYGNNRMFTVSDCNSYWFSISTPFHNESVFVTVDYVLCHYLFMYPDSNALPDPALDV